MCIYLGNVKHARPVLTICYQYDPWHSTIGGIQTIISSFIKYAPDTFNIRLVGTSGDPSVQTGIWHQAKLANRSLSFLPLFTLVNDDVRHLVPTTLRYTSALSRHQLKSDFFHFHRIEPTLVTDKWPGHKALFIHNDIQQQVLAKNQKKAILWRYMPSIYFALERRLIKQFDQILSCNSNAVDFYKANYPHLTNRISLIRNSVDSERFYPWSTEELQHRRTQFIQQHDLPANTRFLLFAGRLHPQKEPLQLIRSFAELNEPDLHLLVAGDGELFRDVERSIEKLNLRKRVTLLGAVEQEILADLHRLSSVFVLTSSYEGLPLVVLEALACGTPVVTTNCGETPRLLNERCGIVSPQNSPSSIANSIKAVLDNQHQYTSDACIYAAKPYAAKQIITEFYNSMMRYWETQNKNRQENLALY